MNRKLRASQVRERYGNISDVTLWRRIRDGSIPPPDEVLGGLRMWDEATLDERDQRQRDGVAA